MSLTETSCLVLGAGPAGLSAALWLQHLGVDFLVLDNRPAPGGELPHINLPVHNYLGRPAEDGRAFLAALQEQLAARRLPLRPDCLVQSLDVPAGTATTPCGTFRARALVLAMGLTRRMLDVPGAGDYRGRGISYSATTDMARMVGQRVAVVGGGDGALENALLVAQVARSVTVVHRRAAFSARTSFVEQVCTHPRITSVPDTAVTAILGDGKAVQGLEIQDARGRRILPVDQVVVKIGFVPNTAMLAPGAVQQDGGGYVVVDRWMRTSVPGVLAAGDVCNPRSPCLAAAVGDGALAAQEAFRFLSGTR